MLKTGKGNEALQSWREQVACREELRSHLVQGVLNKINSGSVHEQKKYLSYEYVSNYIVRCCLWSCCYENVSNRESICKIGCIESDRFHQKFNIKFNGACLLSCDVV